ncbi:hypothetical protein EVAR_100001_1 [Eumeta japonica]|uniref:Uncharacterized protein n=1 Tax=Eumeta variegata TaxID=151549 RepID=A0A4C2A424_EUMVA|nr:hypothetical protein EVAR_100001_1 [Eumeta japonica]
MIDSYTPVYFLTNSCYVFVRFPEQLVSIQCPRRNNTDAFGTRTGAVRCARTFWRGSKLQAAEERAAHAA